MDYTINKLAQMAGVSTRTLRYYDELELLKPARINSSGYRIYGESEVDMLQQILFYRELDVNLEDIKSIITDKKFDKLKALKEHKQKLLDNRKKLDLLIANVEKTILANEGGITMNDNEKFEGFKQKMLDENEEKYGEEIREKYGDETVQKSNQKFKNMTEAEYNEINKLAEDMAKKLVEAMELGDPACEAAQEAADLHKRWLTFYWDSYSKEAHAGLAQMYVDDERFATHYEKIKPGATKFLRDAILIYTSK